MKKVLALLSTLAILIPLYIPYPVSAAADPIAYFKFDDGSGTAPIDSSSNNISASFTSTNPTWTSNVPSAITFDDPYSLDFTGNGDGVTVTWPSNLNFADTDPRSFSFWYKPIANGEGQYSRLISWTSDRLEIAGTSGGGSNHKIAYFDGNWHDTDITLTLGTWYHIIFTYDGTTAKFYINNELQDEHSLAGRSLSGTMRIGNRVQQLDEGINGNIDDVRIYNYALNTTQIENISSGSNNPDGDPTPTPTPTSTPSTSSTNSSSGSSTSNSSTTKTCSDTTPGTPNLFQISTSPNSATLYFSPATNSTGYIVSYGNSPSANQHAVSFDYTDKSGAIPHTIQQLTQNTPYYFKVQAKNNCQTGNWSQTLSQTTTNLQEKNTPSDQEISKPSPSPRGTIEIVQSQTSSKPSSTASQNNITTPDTHDLTIKVASDGKPVSGAVVEIHSTPRKTTTDKDGYARFANIEKGEHTLYLTYNDFTGTEKIVVDGQQKDLEISMNIQLTPQESYFSPSAISVIAILLCIISVLTFLFWKNRKQGKSFKSS
jgi:Concanavalin A-like lectin/glucanases superfamily/Carboxypeptidase regulatory-like domain/Fibronectin type III domain